jgi:HK97 gp10 family phage protein
MTDIGGFAGGAEDLQDLADALEAVADEVDDAVDRAVRKTALDIEAQAKRKAPVDTGTLRSSIQARRLTTGRWAVGTPVEYAAHVEYGTGPHLITPNGDDPLTFKVDGEWVSTYEVEHPGTPAQPYLRPALAGSDDDLVERIGEEIETLLDEHL